MPRIIPLGLAFAALITSLPAIAGTSPPVVDGMLPWVSGGLSLGTLLALAVQWGRTRQPQADHARRICAVETCAGTTPQRLASMEGTLQTRGERDDERHREVCDRMEKGFDRLESRLESHTHGE